MYYNHKNHKFLEASLVLVVCLAIGLILLGAHKEAMGTIMIIAAAPIAILWLIF